MARSSVGTNTTMTRISHAQSSTIDGLQPSVHRLDLLITEQRTLVKSTQESLQQALAKYESSKSKEEQESARIQVESLLTRAQELVTTVQVILHIRCEISHIQQEIRRGRARHESMSELHGRLQWLEQRLEKILMARRRGRPGGHGGRRGQAPFPTVQTEAMQPRGLRRKPLEREAISLGTPSRGDTFSDFDRLSAQDTPWKSESTEASNTRNVHSRSPFSSKHSASQDSDAWHSESEANWTMVEVYSNQPKDITQSQVLSEDEPKPSRLTGTTSHSKSVATHHSTRPPFQHLSRSLFQHSTRSPFQHEITPEESIKLPFLLESASHEKGISLSSSSGDTSQVQGMRYNFESIRPYAVFGECSWNSLPLAVNTNFVQSASAMTQDVLGISVSMLLAGTSDIKKDIESLKKLIFNAGLAASKPGPLVSANKTAVHFILSSRTKSATKSSDNLKTENRTTPDGLTDLLDKFTPECSKISPSKKVYGKQVTHNRSSTYPRMSNIWYKDSGSPQGVEGTTRPILVSSESVPYNASLVRPRSRILVRRKTRVLRALSRESHCTDKIYMFEREKHQEACVEHLIAQTESSVIDERRNSVQALGTLSCGGEKVEKRLQGIMVSDKSPLIQYEALKTLISLGIINDEVLTFTNCCLRAANELRSDLLSFLSQEHIVPHLSKKIDEGSPSAIEALHENLSELLQISDSPLPFHAALLLSQVGLERDKCIDVLKQALNDSSQERQSRALRGLIRACHCTSGDVIHSALQQMKRFYNWRLRQQSVESLMLIDKKELMLAADEAGKHIYDVLLKRLSSEPILSVRITIGKLLTHLGLGLKAENTLVGKLESKNEVVRAEAIMALSGFEIKASKHIRALIECLDLDPSTYVRVQVVKLFGSMRYHSPVILKQLIEKSKGKGPVAKECVAVLQKINKMS